MSDPEGPDPIATATLAMFPIIAVITSADPSRLVSLAVVTVLSGLLVGAATASLVESVLSMVARRAR
jgi:hypothetical protein